MAEKRNRICEDSSEAARELFPILHPILGVNAGSAPVEELRFYFGSKNFGENLNLYYEIR